jgi:DNA-binding transcriptional ArsR family regulator
MELSTIAETLEALGHVSRLKIVALLAKEQSGLPAGEIASRLGIGKSTLSAQLRMLTDGGVLDSD